ncbi:aspartyl aminopeptidase-like isoform X2 [Dysidea avara]|uniref:aspartyl aminopeptidase-like isoform X2 n=1 Tax=Dysidea avara TaxID=196820 RepID=UPI00332D6B47
MSSQICKASTQAIMEAAKDFISFVDKGVSPYHVVQECKRRLTVAGFSELNDRETWNIKPSGKYYVINNFSTITAFAVGAKFKPGNGFSMVGAHTDSPCLKVKPRSLQSKHGYLTVGVECYGGGIWHTWFDRDLTVAGRVVRKTDKGLIHQLVHINRPILRVPNICIHLNRDHNTSFGPNKESQIVPVLATAVQDQLCEKSSVECSATGKHHSLLIDVLCKELGCGAEQVMDFDLHVADTQPSAIGGVLDEFIFAPRLDNLVNCYGALQGLLASIDSLEDEGNIRFVALYDNEEVGSESAQGAASAWTEHVLRRLSVGGSSTSFEEAMAKSYLVSADQAHAVHPNYAEKHEQMHRPSLHGGIVLKINSNLRYATNAITCAILREIASRADVPLQEFVVRNDSPCGSTIGPIMAAKLGVRTIDIGTPQLSMHSIREMSCTSGVWQAVQLYKAFFNHYPTVDAGFQSA